MKTSIRRPGAWRPLLLAAWLAAWGTGPLRADGIPALPRHALEQQALNKPEQVLEQLPVLLERASIEGRSRELALLLLAKANACRVIADWRCQRDAGSSAHEAALRSGDPILRARARVAESRAAIAMQDFTQGEELLGEAELLLKSTPSPELSADVFLAYSSLSHALGKHALSAEYASRGLAVLTGDVALPMQARLLRNLARAQAQLGQGAVGQASLLQARLLTERIDDPKLRAEILLEAARIARLTGSVAEQVANGRKVIELAEQLHNSQLLGLGHEVLGLAGLDAGDAVSAIADLTDAYQSFRALGLKRDEVRVLRELLRASIDRGEPRTVVDAMVRRFLEIDGQIEVNDRTKAADDFDARMKYAERELDVLRLKDEAVLASERERTLASSNRQARLLSVATVGTLLVLGSFLLWQRRSNRRLTATLALLRESEARSMDLLNLSAGFVFLHDTEGRLLLVNPAAAQALGRTADFLVGRLLQDFQPRAGREGFEAYLERVRTRGEDQGDFLVRSGEGDHRHWRYSSRLSAPQHGRAYVVGNAVDVTDQVQHTRALHEQSMRDALTGSYNRRHLEVFEGSHHPAERWAAITVDLDHFKQVNDTQGHDRGDQVLIDFAQYLLQRVRGGDSVVRLGGDEFVVLLARADAAALQAIASRLRQDCAAAPCAFSTGIALRLEHESLAGTIARADAAMYAERASVRGHDGAGEAVGQASA